MKKHVIDEYHSANQPGYVSNGLIGLRIGAFPLQPGTVQVNGFYAASPKTGLEQLAEVPWVFGWDCIFQGKRISTRPDRLVFEKQEYDFSCAEHLATFRINMKDANVQVDVRTWCSRTQPTLAIQETTFHCDTPVDFAFETSVELRGYDGGLAYQCRPKDEVEGVILWESRGAKGRLGIAHLTDWSEGDVVAQKNGLGYEEDSHLSTYAVKLVPGSPCTIRKMVSLVTDALHDEPHWQAYSLVRVGKWHGFDELREANRAAWVEIWRARVCIDSDTPEFQDAADAAFFYLHSTAHPSMPCSMAPYGLSSRTQYSGLVFWDAETFMFPALLMAQPKAARAMLDYRFRCLPRARDNARLNGFQGIQFPWESGVTGSEVGFTSWPNAIIEHHVSLDIALAFAQYVHATGDEFFFKEKAWPVLQGVAEWIVSRVTRTSRGYEIRHVTCVDENCGNIHNNAYTNIAAIMVLREASRFAERLGYAVPASWTAVESDMFIPIDSDSGRILQHDGACTDSPEVLACFYPLGYSYSNKVDEATARHGLELAQRCEGGPMFPSVYAAWACRWNERSLGRHFLEGMLRYRVDPFYQFNEFWPDAPVSRFGWWITPQTLFHTNLGGLLMTLMMGLPRLRLGEGEPTAWFKDPVVLPEGWREISMDRIWLKDRPWRLVARQGAVASLTPVDEGCGTKPEK